MADAKEKAPEAQVAASAAETAAKAETTVKEAAKETTATSAKRGRKPGTKNKKPAAKKTTTAAAKKAPAKKTTAAKKPAAKKTAKTSAASEAPVVILQFYGEDANINDIVEKVKEGFVNEGHRASSIKKLQVYLKPEERAAYYVINDKQAGKVDLF